MLSIPKNQVFKNEVIIKKSKFIIYMKYITSKEEAQNFIKEIKSIHPDATHNCSAYIYNQTHYKNDDGEPSGTAGAPMLDVLIHKNLNNICVIVTRYFGGVKLGASGLIRAYSKSVSTSLDLINLTKLVKAYYVCIYFDYNLTKIIDYITASNNISINTKQFLQKVKYTFYIEEDKYSKIEKLIQEIDHTINLEILEKTYIGVENNE